MQADPVLSMRMKAPRRDWAVESIGEVIDKFAAVNIDVIPLVRTIAIPNMTSNSAIYIVSRALAAEYNIKLDSILTRGKELDFIIPKVDHISSR